MQNRHRHPKWYNRPLQLSRRERKKPHLVIDDFFDHYHLEEARQLLWNWTTEILSSDNNLVTTPRQRSNVLFFYEKMNGLVEAAKAIQQKRQQKAPTVTVITMERK